MEFHGSRWHSREWEERCLHDCCEVWSAWTGMIGGLLFGCVVQDVGIEETNGLGDRTEQDEWTGRSRGWWWLGLEEAADEGSVDEWTGAVVVAAMRVEKWRCCWATRDKW